MNDINRRRVLRGMLGGGAITVGLPLLNCFLNGNGTAFADGKPLPLRFGTWHWGLGFASKVFVPKKYGANYDLPEEIAFLKPVQQHVNILTNFQAFRDGYENFCHLTGWVVTRSGAAPRTKDSKPNTTFDVTIANEIGRTTRYKTLTGTASGGYGTVSYENPTTPNPAEGSPIQFYTRLFGPDFQDPNASAFTPNPQLMTRKSVLSVVMNDVKRLNTKVGTEDRARLDQYFSGLRDLERQFEQRLTKPEPLAACKPMKKITEEPDAGSEVKLIAERHRLIGELLAMAVACDQTRVFNMGYGGQGTVRQGYEKTHHAATHEERMDEVRGYQENVSWFTRREMEAWAQYVGQFAAIKEGDGTLLDNCLIVADSDHSLARIHSLENMAMFTAGKLGGKVKTGLHIDGGATSTTRLGYTSMKLMGVDVPSFGSKSNETSKEIGEILA
jgi:hypothetical protein